MDRKVKLAPPTVLSHVKQIMSDSNTLVEWIESPPLSKARELARSLIRAADKYSFVSIDRHLMVMIGVSGCLRGNVPGMIWSEQQEDTVGAAYETLAGFTWGRGNMRPYLWERLTPMGFPLEVWRQLPGRYWVTLLLLENAMMRYGNVNLMTAHHLAMQINQYLPYCSEMPYFQFFWFIRPFIRGTNAPGAFFLFNTSRMSETNQRPWSQLARPGERRNWPYNYFLQVRYQRAQREDDRREMAAYLQLFTETIAEVEESEVGSLFDTVPTTPQGETEEQTAFDEHFAQSRWDETGNHQWDDQGLEQINNGWLVDTMAALNNDPARMRILDEVAAQTEWWLLGQEERIIVLEHISDGSGELESLPELEDISNTGNESEDY